MSLRIVLSILILLAITPPALAQSRTVPVDVPAQRTLEGVELHLELRSLTGAQRLARRTTRSASDGTAPTVRDGDQVVICVEATRDGYVTLWSRGGSGRPAVIYPNRYSHSGAEARAERVQANQGYCVGEDERFRLQVQGEAGSRAEVYLEWTSNLEHALGEQDYPVIGRSSAQRRGDIAATSLEFRIVE